jgi:AAA domain-containing protein
MANSTTRRFVVVSGLPGSGKTTLGRTIARRLDLAFVDKDAILDDLFALRGTGDAEWRRALSRESDRLLQDTAAASSGAVLVSFWHVPGMPADSGTPTAWIRELSARVVNVRCVCSTRVAAERFFRRHRHAGHLDPPEFEMVLARVAAQAGLGALDIEPAVDVDTTGVVDIDRVVEELHGAFSRLGA